MERSLLITQTPEKFVRILKKEPCWIHIKKLPTKLKPPFHCYICCANKAPYVVRSRLTGNFELLANTSKSYRLLAENRWGIWNGKVGGHFICTKIVYDKLLSQYAFFLEPILIFDEPMDITKFYKICPNFWGKDPDPLPPGFLYSRRDKCLRRWCLSYTVDYIENVRTCDCDGKVPIKKCPNVWQYVDGIEGIDEEPSVIPAPKSEQEKPSVIPDPKSEQEKISELLQKFTEEAQEYIIENIRIGEAGGFWEGMRWLLEKLYKEGKLDIE